MCVCQVIFMYFLSFILYYILSMFSVYYKLLTSIWVRINRSHMYEDTIRQDLCLMFLTGISTRSLSMISKKLVGRKISAGEVSNVNKELKEAAEKWRTRDLLQESIKYMFLDGVCFDIRIGKSIETVPVLVAIGVEKTGHKLVLGLQVGDKESASNWREFFKDLKTRGLNGRR